MNRPSCGGLWSRTSRQGNKFLSGEIELGGQKYRIVIFANGLKKAGEKTPDYRIFESEPPQTQGAGENSDPKPFVADDSDVPF